jgi:FecR protein
MKSRFLSSFAVLVLSLVGVLPVSLQAQTTDEGAGPSEQPSAPMEMGRPAPPPSSQVYQGEKPDAGQPMPQDQTPQPGQPPQMNQPMSQEAQPGGPSGEAPAEVKQGVGRVSMTHGDVSTQRGDSGDWSAAILNQPVVMGDKVSTGAGGRAEVQLDFANILRLGANSQANIANFTKDHIQIQLAQGRANYSVFNESEAEPEIDTPNVSIHPAHKDVIVRIEIRPDGDTTVIVRKGEAQISTPKGIAEVKQGEMATIRGSAEDAQYKISAAPDRDDWDRWNSDRDRMIHSADAWHHTNRYFTGSEDLDANGRWQNAPDYGQVWVPNEPAGWAPYRDGNWVWEPYYGWTWVGYEPWGWAPYHYGRWMWYGGSWAWWPGPVWGGGFYRPFWAPAYVSFFGFGGGFGFGFGWGGFGWLPIGPCDRFFPWWGGYGGRFGVVGFNRFGTLNRYGGFAPLHGGTRFSNISHMSDPHIGGALSTVGAGRFGAGRTTAVAASHEQINSARMITGNLPVVPSHASLSASGRAAAPSTIHNRVAQHFAGAQSGTRPESFQQQAAHLQQAMQQNHVSAVTAGRGSVGSEPRGVSGTARAGGATASGRESNGFGKRSNGSQSSERSMSERSANERSVNERSVNERSASERSQSERSASEGSSANRGESNGGEWKSFSQSSRDAESAGRGESGSAYSGGRGGSGSYWNRTAPSSSYSRGSGSVNSLSGGYERGGASSRPQLSMRQPIVQPRSYGGYGDRGYGGAGYGGSYGGYRGSPGYSGGSRSAPSYGGSRGGYSGGSHSALGHGEGHSSGGSSGHSSGGGHSGSRHR